jgi:Domain of unknown function (DUF4251)
MHAKNFILKAGIIMVLLLASVIDGSCQDSKKQKDSIQAAQIRIMVEEQQYFFIAQSTTPSKGGVRQLTGGYNLKVTKDTLVSDLPYFGRAYTASYGSTDGGIKFTSVDFGYKAEPRKKGGWNITLNPKEINTCREMNLTIFEDGSASLNVSSNDKQPISFKGIIAATIK